MEKLNIEQENTREYDHTLLNLWKKNGFLGNPPFRDTTAEQRLKEMCLSYYRLMIDGHLIRVRGSDDKKRELHNQIALIVIGKQRSDIDTGTAEKIANFAYELTTGEPLS
ncbi:MAG: hypothetical protein WCC74_02315 [Minisyncoccia bacterium]